MAISEIFEFDDVLNELQVYDSNGDPGFLKKIANTELEKLAKAAKKTGKASSFIPTEFTVRLPFTRGSDHEYKGEIEIEVERVQKENRFVAVYYLNFPEKSIIEDQAIRDEVIYFAASTAQLPVILKILNYN